MTKTPLAADSPSVMRQQNAALVLEVIRKRGPVSRSRLAREAGLSTPTVGHVVGLLLAKGYVEESDGSGLEGTPKRPGPRARLLSFRANLGYVIGMDVGADSSVVKLANLAGSIVAESRIPHPQPPTREKVLESIRHGVTQVLRDGHVSEPNLYAITIGSPGVIDPLTGTISLAPQIAGWDGSKLADDLRDLAPCPIVIENEANLALLAEQWLGGAKDSRDVVLVQVGVGIGSALLIGGQIYRGNGGAAGEIAYLTVGSVGDDSPPEGLEGSFEWIAGGNAYRRYGSLAAARGGGEKLARLAGGDPLNVTARTVFDAAAQNDRVALEIVSLLVGRLSRGIADMVTILNPELVLIGGGISGAGELILEPIREAVQRLSPNPPLIALSQLGIEGTALGAVRRSIEIADEQIFFFRTEARKDSLPS